MNSGLRREFRYTEDHCWARQDPDGITIGITDFAQSALGAIVVANLPEVGNSVDADEKLCEVESTKAVSEVYAPVSGTVAQVNNELADDPGRLNTDPYGAGWICTISPSDASEFGALLDADAYAEFVGIDTAGAE